MVGLLKLAIYRVKAHNLEITIRNQTNSCDLKKTIFYLKVTHCLFTYYRYEIATIYV